MKKEGIVVFFNTHEAIKADNIMIKSNVNVNLISTSPQISLGCGFMLTYPWEYSETVINLLISNKIDYKALYYSEKEKGHRKITLLYEKDNNVESE